VTDQEAANQDPVPLNAQERWRKLFGAFEPTGSDLVAAVKQCVNTMLGNVCVCVYVSMCVLGVLVWPRVIRTSSASHYAIVVLVGRCAR